MRRGWAGAPALTGAVVSSRPAELPAHDRVSGARRWGMLAVGTAAQAASATMVHGPAFLIPVLHDRLGLSLAEAGLVAAAPMAGLMCTLVLWGVVVDRRGERFALLAGLLGTTAAGAGAAAAEGVWWTAAALFGAGAAAAATNSASGRVVVGWFPPERRGLAMGIRQCAQPLGVGVAALTMAVLADRHGPHAALWLPVAATAVAAVLVAVAVIDPPRPAAEEAVAAPNPYRGDGYLARIHAASVLLVVPQFVVWTFGLTWLVDDLGWSAGLAGAVVAGSQLGGALGRIGAGHLSDLVGGRMRPMRWIAWAAVATMLALGAAAAVPGEAAAAAAVVLLVVASAVTVADNGLAYTAVAERSGPFWSGRALGVQNYGAERRRRRRPAGGGRRDHAVGVRRRVRALRPAPARRVPGGPGRPGARRRLSVPPGRLTGTAARAPARRAGGPPPSRPPDRPRAPPRGRGSSSPWVGHRARPRPAR
ncbi:MFS transporter [Nocardioides sp. TF02-7]|uniref:MFS transporter n=1 Tax=Nocardioides sp. TF02-7 TaxID=2917724 RepID=UPI001F05BFF7|nr:MFS transporter [Nocardioides sp. TF02-7]UMG94272.1 MFS transporter [Nocardioides sp. TF02-7]